MCIYISSILNTCNKPNHSDTLVSRQPDVQAIGYPELHDLVVVQGNLDFVYGKKT